MIRSDKYGLLIKLLGNTFCSAKRIRLIIEESRKRKYHLDENKNHRFWWLVGVYDSRLFGLCSYKDKSRFDRVYLVID